MLLLLSSLFLLLLFIISSSSNMIVLLVVVSIHIIFVIIISSSITPARVLNRGATKNPGSALGTSFPVVFSVVCFFVVCISSLLYFCSSLNLGSCLYFQ